MSEQTGIVARQALAAIRPYRGFVMLLALLAVLWWLTLSAYRPGEAMGREAPSREFSAVRAVDALRYLIGDGSPHPIGSAANQEVRDRIVLSLRKLGFEPELHSELICNQSGICAAPVNVLVRVEGSDVSPEQSGNSGSVLLSAHYDSVPAGPGVADNGAGVASIIEIARVLKHQAKTRHSIILLFNEGEEAGLLGAELFIRRHRWAKEVSAVVNLEARGTSGASLMFETGSANRWLMELYADSIPKPLTNSVWYSLYKYLPNGTDFRLFKTAGYQGFNFAFIDHVAKYHTPFDDIEHLDLGSVQQQGELALRAALSLANADIAKATEGEAAFFDVFGWHLVRLPMGALMPIALLVLFSAVAGTILLVRRKELSVRQIAWATGVSVLSLLAAVFGGVLLFMSVKMMAASGLPRFVAHPWAGIGSFAALGLVIVGVATALQRKKAGFWAHWCAWTAWFAILAALLTVVEPGASYLPLLPAIVGALGIALRVLGSLKTIAGRELIALTSLLVMFTIVLPILAQLYSALGTMALPLLVVLTVFSATPILGLLLEAPALVGRSVTGGAALALVLGVVLVFVLPVYSKESPEGLNVIYQVDDAGDKSPSARWMVQSRSGKIDGELKNSLRLEPLQEPRFPWEVGDQGLFATTAPLLEFAEPNLTVESVTGPVSRASSPERRLTYQFHFASGDEAPSQQIAFSAEADIKNLSLKLAGQPSAVPVAVDLPDWEGWKVLRLIGMPSSGIDLTFDAADGNFEVMVVSKSYRLPKGSEHVLRARSDRTVPTNEGNVSVVTRTTRISPGTLLASEAMP